MYRTKWSNDPPSLWNSVTYLLGTWEELKLKFIDCIYIKIKLLSNLLIDNIIGNSWYHYLLCWCLSLLSWISHLLCLPPSKSHSQPISCTFQLKRKEGRKKWTRLNNNDKLNRNCLCLLLLNQNLKIFLHIE